MKRSIALLASASLFILGAPSVSLAQGGSTSGPFADVPADHWAYQAVDTLQKAGIVIGYPDGTYGGKRGLTRYEFAVAIARLLPQIKQPDLSNYATKDDLNALSDDLNSKLASNAQAIDALKSLVNEFQPELQKLGQDVASVQQRLDDLDRRVASVEAEQARVKLNGSLDLIGRADASTQGNGKGGAMHFIDENGVQTGTDTSTRMLQKADVYHNFDLVITGRLTDTATAVIRANFQNYLSAIGNTAAIGYGVINQGYTGFDAQPGFVDAAGSTQTSLREAYVDMQIGMGRLSGATLDVGRIPVQFSKYTLQQVDADVYTDLYETDSGNIPVDGAKVAFKAGPVKLAAFAGKNDSIPFAQLYGGSQNASLQTLLCGCPLNSIQSRPFGQILQSQAAPISQSAGVRASIGALGAIQLNGTLEEFGLNGAPSDPDNGVGYNKLTVYGADINGALPFGIGRIIKNSAIGIDASYTNLVEGGLRTNANYGYKYMQHEEQLTGRFGGLSIKGGYQYVGPYFAAPGYWGKVGSWTNPTNIEGPVMSAKFTLTPKITLNGDYEQYKAAYGNTSSPLQQDDRLNRYQLGVGYNFSSAYAVDLGYEDVLYDLRNKRGALFQPGKPHESYLTIGLNHSLSSMASFKLLYQIVRYDDRSTGFDPVDGNGAVAVGQLSIKF